MRSFFYKGRFFFIPLGIAAILSLVSYVVMQLWNHLMPEITGVTTITFWQAMGLFILCKILFGFGKGGPKGCGPGGAPWMRRKMEERFKNMTPEQRDEFKRKMKDRMCHWRDRDRFSEDWDTPADQAPKSTE